MTPAFRSIEHGETISPRPGSQLGRRRFEKYEKTMDEKAS